MKVSVLKENLKKGLNIVEKAVGRNLSLPILNNVLVVGEKNFLNLITTDLELAFGYWILTKIEKEGKLTVPARLFSNLVNLFPNETINLEAKDAFLSLESGNYQTQLKTTPVDDFPLLPKVKNGDSIQVNNLPFIEGLERVVDFTSPTASRPEISGVFLSFQKKSVTMATTDSFRLAEKQIFFEKPIAKEYSFIVPQRAARELVNTLGGRGGKLTIYLSPNQILFEFPMEEVSHPQIQIFSRLIEGDYPDYKTIVPQKYKTQAILPRIDFLNQLRTAGIFSGKTNEINLKIDPKKNEVEISGQTPEVGQSQSTLTGKIKGEKIDISFNWRFLTDGLSQMESPEVVFELTEREGEGKEKEEGPALLRPSNDPSYLYIVMPTKSS